MAKQPSTNSIEARQVPLDVRHLVLHQSGYKCANPSCRHPLTLDVHHLYYVSEAESNLPDNLVPLCPNCDTEHRNGNISPECLRAWKMLLMALDEAFDRRAIDLLLMVAQLPQLEFITADGLPNYAPLVVSGLVTVQLMMRRVSRDKMPYSCWLARLTDKGRLFVEAWKKGDQRAAIQSLPATGEIAETKGHSHAD
jgi:hypothetical protein